MSSHHNNNNLLKKSPQSSKCPWYYPEVLPQFRTTTSHLIPLETLHPNISPQSPLLSSSFLSTMSNNVKDIRSTQVSARVQLLFAQVCTFHHSS